VFIKKAKAPLVHLFRRASQVLTPYPLSLSTSDKLLVASSSVNSMRARRSDIKQLWDSEIKVFSQWGEDGILTYLLDSIGIPKPKILEIGAGNFEECNSRFQAEFRNASVYLVDQRPDLKPNCESLEVYWKTVILPFNDYVTPLNINSHISLAKQLLSGLDVFSLDIDGNDYWVLLDADLSDIAVVICEYNPLFGSKFSVTVPRDDQFTRESKHFSWLYYGMSLRACVSLLSKKGFTFCGTNLAGNNAFFVNNQNVKFLTLDVPLHNDLSKFTDWRIRESRDVHGKLSFLYGDKRFAEIKNLKVVNTDSNELVELHSVV
jgi:hypothetical protein